MSRTHTTEKTMHLNSETIKKGLTNGLLGIIGILISFVWSDIRQTQEEIKTLNDKIIRFEEKAQQLESDRGALWKNVNDHNRQLNQVRIEIGTLQTKVQVLQTRISVIEIELRNR